MAPRYAHYGGSTSGIYDAVIVGGGHNALVAAAYLAGAGKRVIVLERLGHLGGAAVSDRPWPGVDARLSRYSYLVSLLPPQIIRDLDLRRRRYSSGRPDPVDATRGLLVDNADAVATTPEEVLVHWNAAKAAEKHERRSVLDGVSEHMPALALAQKLLGRAAPLGLPAPPSPATPRDPTPTATAPSTTSPTAPPASSPGPTNSTSPTAATPTYCAASSKRIWCARSPEPAPTTPPPVNSRASPPSTRRKPPPPTPASSSTSTSSTSAHPQQDDAPTNSSSAHLTSPHGHKGYPPPTPRRENSPRQHRP